MTVPKPITVDEYIHQAPVNIQDKLHELRKYLKKAAPQAKEMLKWGKPAFEAEYILFVYAGSKSHISFHPTPEAIIKFKGELQDYKTSDNTVQFPLDRSLPVELITRMAAFRVDQSKQGVKWK